MSKFSDSMTDEGRAVLAGYMTAQTPADVKEVTERSMRLTLMTGTEFGPSPADSYALKVFMARNLKPKLAAALLNEAAQIALTAGAYEEALHALVEAQRRCPSKSRQALVDALQKKLAEFAARKHVVTLGTVSPGDGGDEVVPAEVVGRRR